uniref:Mevalonate kinase n=1 Tax=Phallusia mammillata TaxID=59560 RepID=A0A6F9DNG7_9ASCI|nr:mevalonate kinase [Phallusia mammillata]
MNCFTMAVKKITVRAPGKIILHGEHAVVYGKMAIAAAVNGFMEVQLEGRYSEGGLNFKMSDLCEKTVVISLDLLKAIHTKCSKQCPLNENPETWKNLIKEFIVECFATENELLHIALTVSIYCYFKTFNKGPGKGLPSLDITVTSNNLPIGAGLGSSSAFSVALATALLIYTDTIKTSDGYTLEKDSLFEINNLAYDLEQIVHGRPSGVDNAVSTYGGAVKFENGKINHFKSFPHIRIMVVDSGVTRNTKAMVANVKEKYDKVTKVMQPILESFHEISKAAEDLFTNYSQCNTFDEQFKTLITTNHHLLNAIGVGHPKLDEINEIATNNGFASKLTGAGGGGCMFVYLPSSASDKNVEKLKQNLLQGGFKCWEVTLGCPGVTVVHLELLT